MFYQNSPVQIRIEISSRFKKYWQVLKITSVKKLLHYFSDDFIWNFRKKISKYEKISRWKAVVKYSNMSDEMQNDAIKLAKEAFQIEYKDNISKVDFSKISQKVPKCHSGTKLGRRNHG